VAEGVGVSSMATVTADDLLTTPGAAIGNRATTPLARLNPELPPKLEEIINKALEKDRKLSYQHAADMRTDLQRLKRDTESGRSATLETETALASVGGRRTWIAVAALALAVGPMAGGYFYFQRKKVKLTDKDSVVLADFTNRTGDAVFDGTLRQGLAVQLEQSPFLSLISDDRMHQTLRLMGQPADAKLTPETAREICQRTGSAAVLDASIASLGHQYVLGIKAVNCQTGNSLAEEQATADSKEDVLRSLGDAARNLRSTLGESLSSIQNMTFPSCRPRPHRWMR
jgi:eukaryotic-like serine/threonine-protein kinase